MVLSVSLKALAAAALLAGAGCASVLAPALKPNVSAKATALRAGAYELDKAHAALLFGIDHLGFSTFTGRFERFDVSLDFDADNPQAARIEAVIDMTSLDIANDEFAATLMGPDWFDAGAYSEATFRSTAITLTSDNSGEMTGDLTLHGVTLPVTMAVTFNGGGRDRLRGAYIVGFSARTVIDRTAFGVSRFSGLITDEVEITIEAEFIKQ
jgi:polyisoprenoid-binding protein YceI